jgi:dihydrofolate reductase
MIKIIAAVSQNRVIGIDNKLPFSYPEDMKHFKQSTQNSTVIMGRKTFESIGSKPLPNRRNIVITSSSVNIEHYKSLSQAVSTVNTEENVWLIGGASIYQEGMQFCDEMILTVTPDIIEEKNCVKFPEINPLQFKINEIRPLGDNGLIVVTYVRT